MPENADFPHCDTNPRPMPRALPKSIDETHKLLGEADYVADRSLATALYLSLAMQRPLFLEGEAGVGKTEIAKVIAAALGRRADPPAVLRRPGHRAGGLRVELLAPDDRDPLAEAEGREEPRGHCRRTSSPRSSWSRRPLAAGARGREGAAPVLLIDELDRTDEPFEAYLLEMLSDWQITIPEIGTIRAEEPPIVVITSNRTREIHDAVKRRCFYHWVDYPDAARELEILRRKAPKAAGALSKEVVGFVQRLRSMDLFKLPGVAETIDWAQLPGGAGPASRSTRKRSTTRSACCSSTRTTSSASPARKPSAW